MQLWATLLAVAIVILHIIKVIKDTVRKDGFFFFFAFTVMGICFRILLLL